MIPTMADDDGFYGWYWDEEFWDEPDFTGYCDLDCVICYPFD